MATAVSLRLGKDPSFGKYIILQAGHAWVRAGSIKMNFIRKNPQIASTNAALSAPKVDNITLQMLTGSDFKKSLNTNILVYGCMTNELHTHTDRPANKHTPRSGLLFHFRIAFAPQRDLVHPYFHLFSIVLILRVCPELQS